MDLSIAWAEVARVEPAGDQLVVSLHGTCRILRFRCPTDGDALRGSIIASHLASLAQSEPLQQT